MKTKERVDDCLLAILMQHKVKNDVDLVQKYCSLSCCVMCDLYIVYYIHYIYFVNLLSVDNKKQQEDFLLSETYFMAPVATAPNDYL